MLYICVYINLCLNTYKNKIYIYTSNFFCIKKLPVTSCKKFDRISPVATPPPPAASTPKRPVSDTLRHLGEAPSSQLYHNASSFIGSITEWTNYFNAMKKKKYISK